MNADQSVGGVCLEGETTQLVIDSGSRRGRRVGTRPLEEFYSSDRIDNMDDDPDYSDGGMDGEDEESHSSSRESDDDDEQGGDDEKVMVELCRKLRRLVPKYKKSRAPSAGVVQSLNNLMNSAADFVDKVESRGEGRPSRKRKRQISSSSSSSSSSGQAPSASSSFGRRSSDSTQRYSGRNEKRSKTMRLDEHTRRKATAKPKKFKCPDCESSFTRADHLKTHKESKHDMVKFPCVKCGQDFSTKGSMTRHVGAVHDKKTYDCPHCGKACKRNEYLTKHLKDFHPDA